MGKTQITAEWVSPIARLGLVSHTCRVPLACVCLAKTDPGSSKPLQGVTHMSIVAHRIAHVLPGQEAPANSHDEPWGAEPATAAGAGLGIRPLTHQLPCGASPLPLAL